MTTKNTYILTNEDYTVLKSQDMPFSIGEVFKVAKDNDDLFAEEFHTFRLVSTITFDIDIEYNDT